MDIQNIPWRIIDERLEQLNRTQAWLARELDTGTNVVANWRSRGGAPLSRIADVARVLGYTTNQLLLLAGENHAARRGAKPQPESQPPHPKKEALLKAFDSLTDEGRGQLLAFAEFLAARER